VDKNKMQNKAKKYAVISGVSGVLAVSIMILDWGATRTQPSFWNYLFIFIAIVMAAAGLILASRSEKASAGEDKTGEAASSLRFWIRLGRTGSFIVIIWLVIFLVGIAASSIKP
jgi:hypothetical protein